MLSFKQVHMHQVGSHAVMLDIVEYMSFKIKPLICLYMALALIQSGLMAWHQI